MAYIEDSYHELKESVGESLPNVAAAFANTEGGEIVIGIKNNGTVVGLREDTLDQTQQKLEKCIKSVDPVPIHSIERQVIEGKNIIVARISKFADGFCTYKGAFYYRHGSVTDRLGGVQLRDFLASRNLVYFDSQPCANAAIEDIDEEKLANFLSKRSGVQHGVSVIEALKNLDILRVRQGKHEIANAAILFFGKNPYRFFKQNEVRLVSFSGYEASESIIDRIDLQSTVPENVEEALKFIRRNTKASYEVKGLERIEVPEYPERAIREAIVNAAAHRDYFSADATQIRIFSNRIEFINPGTLPDGIDMRNIDAGVSIKRNPIIYQLMRDMHYMEGLATGVPLIKGEMNRAKMPQPRFEIIGSFFKLTLYNRLGEHFNFNTLNERQKVGIEAIRKNGKITSKEYAGITNVAAPTAVADLSKLVKEGILNKIGRTRGAFYIIAEGKG